MKRSEMIDKIQLLLEEQSNFGISYRFQAQMLLEMIEKAEMLPPTYDEFKNRAGAYNDILMVNKWEPEE